MRRGGDAAGRPGTAARMHSRPWAGRLRNRAEKGGRMSVLWRRGFMGTSILALAILLGCGSKNPIEEARGLIHDGELDEARTVLLAAAKKAPDEYRPLYLLAEVAEKKSAWNEAVEWYDKALALPSASRLSSQLKERKYQALLKLASEEAGSPEGTEAVMQRAAAIEDELSMRVKTANSALFTIYKAKFDAARAAGRFDEAMALAESVRGLSVDRERIRGIVSQLPDIERAKFDAGVRQAFDEKVKPGLQKRKVYDPNDKTIVLRGEFTVPAKSPEGLFDPRSEAFERDVEMMACLALRDGYWEILNEWAEASPVRGKLLESHANAFLNAALERKNTGWVTPFDSARPPRSGEGLVYFCEGRLPVDFVAENLRKVDLALAKKAEEDSKAAKDAPTQPDGASEPGSDGGEQADE